MREPPENDIEQAAASDNLPDDFFIQTDNGMRSVADIRADMERRENLCALEECLESMTAQVDRCMSAKLLDSNLSTVPGTCRTAALSIADDAVGTGERLE